jgi:transmembrane sensor
MDHSPQYDIPWELITDSLTGSLSPEDEQKFNAWLSSDSDNREKYSRLRELWINGLEDYSFYQLADEATAWSNLSGRMKSDETIVPETVSKKRKYHFIRNLSGIAAGFLILIATGYLVFFRDNSVVYRTAVDEQREIRLTDGSDVILHQQTRIKVAQDFNKVSRTISIEEGEAVFDVSHQDNPFIVKAGPVRIEDLGTSFIIRKDREKINVEVNSGKVAFIINATNQKKELREGMSITFNINENRFGDITDTRTGQIIQIALLDFENSLLSEVVASVQKIYGIRIGIADSAIGQDRLTADFNGVPFENVINIICKSLNLEYSVKDSTYLLNQKRKEINQPKF